MSDSKLPAARERFQADVARHGMTVLRDDGLYRHLRFRRPDCSAYWFDLLTAPGIIAAYCRSWMATIVSAMRICSSVGAPIDFGRIIRDV